LASEVSVAVARVPGVAAVLGVRLFVRDDSNWTPAKRLQGSVQGVSLEAWELPELLSVVVVADEAPPTDLRAVPNPFANEGADGNEIAVPVVPEVC
ncbi:MAG: putative baseplate assembly protein, partial [Myxococcota bacterium]